MTTNDTDGQTELDGDDSGEPLQVGRDVPWSFWRKKLRRYLAKRAGEPVRFGEITDAVLELIPLHILCRIWAAHHDQLHTSTLMMRLYCLKIELAKYPLRYSPARSRTTLLHPDVLITPQNRACAHCGKPFFGKRKTRCCCRSCSAAIGRAVAAPDQAAGRTELVPLHSDLDQLNDLIPGSAIASLPSTTVRMSRTDRWGSKSQNHCAEVLVRYDAMCQAIQAAYEVDEVKDIRDMALAIEIYSRQAKNTEAERKACEIRLRAERKVGQLLGETDLPTGSPGNQHTGPLQRPEGSKTLADLGISYDQSSQWQQLAALPEAEFEDALAESRPSTSGIIARRKRPTTKQRRRADALSHKADLLWKHLHAFEDDELLYEDPKDVLAAMTDYMREGMVGVAKEISEWLARIGA